jgi:hypothetical protein
MTFDRIVSYPDSPTRYIGGGDAKQAWTPMSGLSLRASPTAPQLPARLHGIDKNGFQSTLQFHIPMVPSVLDEVARAFADLADAVRKADELRETLEGGQSKP